MTASVRRRPGRSVLAAALMLGALILPGSIGEAAASRSDEPGDEAPPHHPGVIRVTLLGTGNPRPSLDRFGPSALVEAGPHRILVDAGRGATMRLFQIGRGELLAGIDRVLLTHLHSDHVIGLPDLWLTGWIFGRDRPLPVHGPPGTKKMIRYLKKAFDFDVRMRRDVDEQFPADGIVVHASNIDPGVFMERGGLRLTAIEVDHRPVRPAYGFRIDFGGRSVAFSGDTRPSRTLIEMTRGVDVLIHEVISPEVETRRSEVVDPERTQRIIDHHTTPQEAGRIFAEVRPKLAVYSHIVPSPALPEDLIPPTRENYDGPLVIGRDLMTITIGARIEVGQREFASDRPAR